LLAIRLFSEIEDRLGKKFPVSLIFQAPTIAKIVEFFDPQVERNLWSPIVPIRLSDSGNPLFLVHGFAGGVVGYADLVNLMEGDRPIFGLQAVGQEGSEPPINDVKEMAETYIKAMRVVQPTGPYFIAGYCFGGIVAYEMACQLKSSGEQVGLAGVFEGYAPVRKGARDSILRPAMILNFIRNLPFWFQDFIQLGWKEMWSVAARRVRRLLKKYARRIGFDAPVKAEDVVVTEISDLPAVQRRMMEAHLQAMLNYTPGPYPGSITLFRIKRISLLRGGDPDLGWGHLAQEGVKKRYIKGSHGTILQPPFVESLACELDKCLAENEILTEEAD
jgi:aspartate racemase